MIVFASFLFLVSAERNACCLMTASCLITAGQVKRLSMGWYTITRNLIIMTTLVIRGDVFSCEWNNLCNILVRNLIYDWIEVSGLLLNLTFTVAITTYLTLISASREFIWQRMIFSWFRIAMINISPCNAIYTIAWSPHLGNSPFTAVTLDLEVFLYHFPTRP